MNENQNEYVDINAHDNYPDSEQKIEIPTMKVIPLKKICMTIGELPSSYLETMTYYEMLIWFIEYLKNNIIPTVNNNAEAIQEVQSVVLALQNYINDYKDSIDSDVEELEEYMNNYFENLDVQEEINNKLDDMLEDGVLEQIIEQFLQLTSLICFDNVADMKLSPNLANGSYAKTLGYYNVNDGGEALYKIRTITNSDIVDNGSIIALNNSSLIAELIINDNKINIKQFGAKGDGITDDKTAIQNALDYTQNKELYFDNSTYCIGSYLSLTDNIIIGNDTIIKVLSNFNNNYMAIPHNKVTLENIKFDCNNICICCLGESHDNTKLTIDNCIFTGTHENINGKLFALNSSAYLCAKEINVTNSQFINNKSHGARLNTNYEHTIVNIDNCEFSYNGIKDEIISIGLAQYGGLEGTKYEKVTISNCYAEHNANTGIAPHSCNNVIISNCVSNNNGEHGICLQDGKNGIIADCTCINNFKYGIRIQGDYKTSDIYHGYKNCNIHGCIVNGNGVDIDENIDTISITDNIFNYQETGTDEIIKGIRIGKLINIDSFVKNANIINNYFYNYRDFPIQAFITLDSTNNFNNYIDGKNSKLYKQQSNYFLCDTGSSIEYGNTDNILTYPTDFSQWSTVDGSTISNNVITRGTSDFVARFVQPINNPPRFVSLLANFEDYETDADFSIGLRFRNSSNEIIGDEYRKLVRLKGNYMSRIFDVTNISGINYSDIAKIEVILHLTKGSIKMNYCYCSLTDKQPILPNII